MRLTERETKILRDEFEYITEDGRHSVPFDNIYITNWGYNPNSVHSLIRKNIICKMLSAEGETFYTLTDLGISLVNLIGGNNK